MKNSTKTALLIVIVFSTALPIHANTVSELFTLLKDKDSELFEKGFDKCDLSVTESLIMDDLEFYHDKSGIDKGKDKFLGTMRTGLCRSGENEIRRHLIAESLQVFPMFDDGELYGAIQMGKHGFAPAGQKMQVEPARFMHLWLLVDGQWKISRVLSYDHH